MTQETLEEAAARYTCGWGEDDDEKAFIAGAKWQQERMYSEEEVNLMFDTLKENSIDNVATITNVDLFISSWKRQFKKK